MAKRIRKSARKFTEVAKSRKFHTYIDDLRVRFATRTCVRCDLLMFKIQCLTATPARGNIVVIIRRFISCTVLFQGDNVEGELAPQEVDGHFTFKADETRPPDGFKFS